jgi:D-amino-acid dehydrogenase
VLHGDSAETTDYDAVVICAGAASRELAAQVGDDVNVYPVKGYSVTLHLDDAASQAAAPQVSLVDDTVKLVCSRLGDNRLRVAGTAEFHGFNRDIRADRIAPLIDWVQHNFPEVSTRSITPWAGLRPMMPDLMPRVGPARRRACSTTPATATWAGRCAPPPPTWSPPVIAAARDSVCSAPPALEIGVN